MRAQRVTTLPSPLLLTIQQVRFGIIAADDRPLFYRVDLLKGGPVDGERHGAASRGGTVAPVLRRRRGERYVGLVAGSWRRTTFKN